MRTPLAVMAFLFVALLALSSLGGEEPKPATTAAPDPAPVAVIAERVEALRALEFDRLPRPQAVTGEQARREGLEDLDRVYPEERRRADEEVLKLLGLVEPDLDLRELSGSLFGEGVAGYYDPRTGRLRTVKGAATGTTVLAEMVLAHELTHALEDQVFDLDLEQGSGDDADLARLALVEGSAMAVMSRYLERHFTTEEALGGLLGAAFQDTAALPPALQAQLLFPYTAGDRFVRELLRRGGGSWDLVDLAHRTRPPASSEQVLHPRAYFEADEPEAVRLDAARLLGDGWERAAAGTWGELMTRELLESAGVDGAQEAAAGWGGDRYELWRARPIVGDGCAAPCEEADVLLMRWRWDRGRDAGEFATALRAFADVALDGRPAAVARDGRAVTLALAPGASLAERLARAA